MRRITIILILLLSAFGVKAQEKALAYSHYSFNGLALNPAYAGADEALSLTLLHRSQWTGLENAPSTQSFSGHALIKKKQVGLGLTVIRDRIGVHKTTNVLTNYAYHIKISNEKNDTLPSMILRVYEPDINMQIIKFTDLPWQSESYFSINV